MVSELGRKVGCCFFRQAKGPRQQGPGCTRPPDTHPHCSLHHAHPQPSFWRPAAPLLHPRPAPSHLECFDTRSYPAAPRGGARAPRQWHRPRHHAGGRLHGHGLGRGGLLQWRGHRGGLCPDPGPGLPPRAGLPVHRRVRGQPRARAVPGQQHGGRGGGQRGGGGGHRGHRERRGHRRHLQRALWH